MPTILNTPGFTSCNKAVLILSGGLDSSTLGYWLKANGCQELICVSYNYGQRHIVELEHAQKIAARLGAAHQVIDVSFLKDILKGSSLTDSSIPLPEGDYNKENMQSTVVPNRNTILLSLAWSIACVENADVLAYGAHGGDHYLYPDTRPDYFSAINLALRLGTEDCRNENLQLTAPFLYTSKAEIVRIGTELQVPFNQTWTCYAGGTMHCGTCGACHSRKQAFTQAGITDPTSYKV